MNPKKSVSRGLVIALIGILIFSQVPGAQAASVATDGFNPGADDEVYTLAVQSDGKILVGGSFTHLGAGGTTPCSYLGRLNPDGSLDTCFGSGTDGTVHVITVQPDDKILVGGAFTSLAGGARANIGRLNADGTLDVSFDPGANGTVKAILVQPDDKILVGGDFTTLAGVGHNHVGRLTEAGASDNTFTAGTDGVINALATQLDGKILVGGAFINFFGIPALSYIGRINPTDTADTTFVPQVGGPVEALAIQADGKIVLGGTFTSLNGQAQKYIGRLNLNGTMDMSFATANIPNGAVHSVVVQPDGKVLVGGSFTKLGSDARNYIGRYNNDGSLDTSFSPNAFANAGGLVHALAVQPDGKILVGGLFTQLCGSPRNSIGRLYPDGLLDTDLNPGANNIVYALAVQPDGKILVGGSFSMLAGVSRNFLGRLNPDGTLDASFTPELNGAVMALAVQPGGEILVGGDFTTMGIYNRGHIGRLLPDGSVDTSFDPGASGANSIVYALVIQPDGKILVGGNFTTLHGTNRARLGRLESNGDLDATFDAAASGANGTVYTLALQPQDNAVLVGGNFTTLKGTNRAHIGRLTSVGDLDITFNPGATGASGLVDTILLQSDGKILVGGDFTTLGGSARNRIGRLTSAGALDTGFDPGLGANDKVLTMALQANGKVLLGGMFTSLHGTSLARIGRLDPNGNLDTSFTPDADATVYALALQQDGKVLVGGDFTALGGGNPRDRIGRLSSATAALEYLTYDKGTDTLTWERSGAGPELLRVTFEDSSDSLTYSLLGEATRIPGGWQISSLSPAVGQHFLRARGYYSTADHTGSSSAIETVRNMYIDNTLPAVADITLASINPTNAPSVDFKVTFTVPVTGVDVTDFAPTGDLAGVASIGSLTGSGDTYIVTVNTGGGVGSLGLQVLNDFSIIDAYKNTLTSGYTSLVQYTIDATSLTVMSVTRRDTDPHTSPSVRFWVTFSEAVTNVVSSDFTPTFDGTLGGVSVTEVSGSGDTYLVTVGFDNPGDGHLGLDVNTSGAIVGDPSTNPLSAGYIMGETYVIDQTRPTALSSATTSDVPTSINVELDFLVTFSEPVGNVVMSDFTIVSDGDLTNMGITEVSGIGDTRTVTVNSGSGSGNLSIAIAGGNAIQDLATNTLDGGIATSAAYAIDRHAPTVASIELESANPTRGVPYVDYKVTFSDTVTGVDISDFLLTPTGGVTAAINSLSGSGATYSVRVNTVVGTGTLRLDVKSSGTGIQHDVYNLLGGFDTGQAYAIDQTAPIVSASLRSDLTNPTNASTVHFTVLFSEPVTLVDAGDFELTTTGGFTANIASVSALDTKTYNVTVDTIANGLYGILRLDVKSSGVSIQDLYGNAFTGGFTTGQYYTLDRIVSRIFMPVIHK